MRWRSELRSLALEPEPPDAWAMAADVVRQELADREALRAVEAIEGLSRDGWMVAITLWAAPGPVAVVDARHALACLAEPGAFDFEEGLLELVEAGLACTWLVLDPEVWPPLLTVGVRLDVDVPGME